MFLRSLSMRGFKSFADTTTLEVEPGMRLSELEVQETYSFELGRVFIGADDHDQLEQRFAEIERMLPFDIER